MWGWEVGIYLDDAISIEEVISHYKQREKDAQIELAYIQRTLEILEGNNG